MADITRLPTRSRPGDKLQGLTSAHRFLIYSIWDLCTHISERTDHKAAFRYAGHVHTLAVDITPPEHLAECKGGDGSHRCCWEAELRLPPNPLAEPDTLQQLGDIITTLQSYLPPEFTPGGAA